jgi:aryl-alcohol dehydrogenase-like predicted oxidoreductase
MDDTSFDVEEGFGDAVIIGASSTKHREENLVDLEKGPLPEEVVQALNVGWGENKSDTWKALVLSE